MKPYKPLVWLVAFILLRGQGIAFPSFSLQPTNQAVNQGFNATLQATGKGAPPLQYQWFFASNSIPGAITNSLIVTNCQPTNAGDYFVILSDTSGSVTSKVATLTVYPPVSLDPKLGKNIRIGADPFTKTNLHQAEIHIDRSPTDPKLLLAAYQDALSVDYPLSSSYAISKDGGLTWASAFIPAISKLNGGVLSYPGDNVTAIDLNGNMFLTTLAFSLSGGKLQKLSYFFSGSSDGGQTFSTPLLLATSDSAFTPDKGWVTVNTFAGSPFAGRIAFTYSYTALNFSSSQTALRYSDDQGKTWSADKKFGPGQAVGTQTFFLPDGTLAVLYRRENNGQPLVNLGPASMEVMLSHDGGDTFDQPLVVQDLPGQSYSTYPEIWDAVHFPSACSDRQAGVIYVSYQQFGLITRRIMFTKSIDKGRTWSTPLAVNDTPNNLDVFNPALAVSPDGQHVIIEFYDRRNQTSFSQGKNVDLYLAESFDGGDTWEPNTRLSDFSSDLRKAAVRVNEDAGSFLGDYQSIVPSLNFEAPAVATWIDTRAGNNDPYSVRINRTRGTTFETWRKLRFSTNDLASANISGETADPDGDRIPNLAEYALGLEPTKANSSPVQIGGSSSSGRPTVTVSYERLAVLGDILCSWQESTNLADWTVIKPEHETISSGHEPCMQRVDASFAVEQAGKFYRQVFLRTNPIR